jgi:hypothetical protein
MCIIVSSASRGSIMSMASPPLKSLPVHDRGREGGLGLPGHHILSQDTA